MAQDATGTPTPLGIPKFNTAVDAPSGKGANAQMDAIDTLLTARVSASLVDAKGDLLPGTANDTVGRLAVGADGTVLTADSAQSTGIKWATPSGVPTGSIIQYGAAAAPSGWVLCDGTSYLRSGGGVDALFAVIGTTYGAADGTHFNVPDFRGRVPTGYAASGGHTDVSTLGNSDGVAAANRRSKHRHTAHSHSVNSNVFDAGSQGSLGHGNTLNGTGNPTTTSVDGGSGNANDSLDAPAYLVVNYIIKT